MTLMTTGEMRGYPVFRDLEISVGRDLEFEEGQWHTRGRINRQG